MSLTALAIGYILLAMAELAPKFIKDKDTAGTISFACAFISLAVFAASLLDTYLTKQ